MKHYATEVTPLPFSDGVVEDDVSTLSTADYADYNAFVNAEAGKWKEVEDDIRRKHVTLFMFSCIQCYILSFHIAQVWCLGANITTLKCRFQVF